MLVDKNWSRFTKVCAALPFALGVLFTRFAEWVRGTPLPESLHAVLHYAFLGLAIFWFAVVSLDLFWVRRLQRSKARYAFLVFAGTLGLYWAAGLLAWWTMADKSGMLVFALLGTPVLLFSLFSGVVFLVLYLRGV